MVRRECGCGHILYDDNRTCPICGRSMAGAPISNKAFHEIGTEPDCACYRFHKTEEEKS